MRSNLDQALALAEVLAEAITEYTKRHFMSASEIILALNKLIYQVLKAQEELETELRERRNLKFAM